LAVGSRKAEIFRTRNLLEKFQHISYRVVFSEFVSPTGSRQLFPISDFVLRRRVRIAFSISRKVKSLYSFDHSLVRFRCKAICFGVAHCGLKLLFELSSLKRVVRRPITPAGIGLPGPHRFGSYDGEGASRTLAGMPFNGYPSCPRGRGHQHNPLLGWGIVSLNTNNVTRKSI